MAFHLRQPSSETDPSAGLPRPVETVGRRSALRRRLIDDLRVLALAAILAGTAWLFTGQRLAAAFALAAMPVLLGQAVAIATLSVLRRRAAVEAIAAGYEEASLAEIAEVRAELLVRDHRVRLVQRLVGAANAAELGPPSAEPYVARMVPMPQLRTARGLLEQVVLLLLREPCDSARGVALCELLLERSAFHIGSADDQTRLEHDLQRIRFVLRPAWKDAQRDDPDRARGAVLARRR